MCIDMATVFRRYARALDPTKGPVVARILRHYAAAWAEGSDAAEWLDNNIVGFWSPGSPGPIVYLAAIQVLSGCAKDLVKLGGKTVTKLVTPEEKTGTLFKLVSMITGELERGGKGDGDAETETPSARSEAKEKEKNSPPSIFLSL